MFNDAIVTHLQRFKLLFFSSLSIGLILGSCRQAEKESPNHPREVDYIIDISNKLLNIGKVHRSLHYLDSAFAQIQNPGPTDLWKKYNHKVNFYLNYDFNLKKAKLNADSMMLILEGRGQKYKTEYANAIFAKGHVLLAEKRYTEAFKRYYDARAFALKYLDSCSYYEFTYKLGLVRYNQGQYLKAVPYFKQALTENTTCKSDDDFNKDFFFQQSTFTAISLAYELANMPKSAVRYYHKGLTFIDRNAHKYPGEKVFIATARGVIFGNLGGTYAKLNQDKEAEHYLNESIRINSSPGHDFQDAQTAKLKLTGLYIRSGRYQEAKKLLDELEAYLGEKGNNPTNEGLRLRWYKIKLDYFDQTKQYLQAYIYSQKIQKVQDSVNRVNEGLKKVDMDEVFKDTEQQYKLALLSKDNKLKTSYLLIFVIFSVMSVGILAGVWYSLKRSWKLNDQLSQKNDQLQLTLGSLEQSQQENTRIMKIVAHDLRSPLAATVSIATLLLENKYILPEDREMLGLMKTSMLHSLEMITDLLNMNITAEGLKKEPVEMHTLLRYCIDLLKFKANEKKQKIILHAQVMVININREKIWRVISNLIVNAIKFSPEGSDIELVLLDQGDSVLIKVADHGIGIPDDIRDKVFDMFTDARRKGTSGEHSFGLGLAISRQIIEAHGGKIWFHSITGQSTTFYIELFKV